MSKIIATDRAAALIKDGATVAATGFGLAGWAEEIGISIEKCFVETGHPAGITFIHASNIADWNQKGIERFAKEGLVKRWIGSFIGAARTMSRFVAEDKMEAYCLPQGVLAQLYREIAAGRPGILSKVGLGTFVDPRLEGGKMNSVTKDDIVKVVEFEGEEWLFYKSFPIEVALIRGSVVDEKGNLTMDREGLLLEALSLAQATRNTGGIVIAQAEYLAKAGTLPPKNVTVPGILVDHIVMATSTENCFQTEALYFSPAFAGHIKVPLHHIPTPPLDERLVIARRAAMELSPGAVVNLGVGIPTMVGSVAAGENVSHLMTMTTEAGNIGGVPANPPNFAHAYNAEATITQDDQFAFYDGGGLDLAFLGLAQTDKEGNVNVSKFNNRVIGCGGFIDITQNTRKVVFCGTFTDGLNASIENGRMTIVREGKGRKFLDKVEQITFSGRYASKTGQDVLFVTERAVFTLEEGTMTLIEIAPGIELERDILALMEFTPRISPDLRLMPSDIFGPTWGKLADIVGPMASRTGT
jgi:propionate CoA-transferase